MGGTVTLDVGLRLNLRFDSRVAKRVCDGREPFLARTQDCDVVPRPRAQIVQSRLFDPLRELLRLGARLDRIDGFRVYILRADIEANPLSGKRLGAGSELNKIYLVPVAIQNIAERFVYEIELAQIESERN